jgi:hypothetical protein
VTLRTVALSNTTAPGTASTFSEFVGGPVLNDFGHVAFLATILGDGLGPGFDSSIWSEGGGSSLQLVAREGFPAPGAPFAVFDDFIAANAGRITETFQINNSGDIAILGQLSGITVDDRNKSGIWASRDGAGLQLIARTGALAPGANARFALLGDGPRIDEAGRVAFLAFVSSDGTLTATDQSIWREGSGGLQLVARSGSDAPMTDATFGAFFDPQINPNGQTAFWSLLFVDEVNEPGSGIWAQTPGDGLELVTREGQSAPGTNAVFATLGGPGFNNSRQTAFRGSLAGSQVTPQNAAGIWSQGGTGSLHLVARSGDNAPGTNSAFAAFENPVINARGDTAFVSTLVGIGIAESNDSGIWSEAGGEGLKLVAREGSNAPGTDAQFANLIFRSPVLNRNGQIAFAASLTKDGADVGAGIWATDTRGNLNLIARTGEQLDVDNGPAVDLRSISSVSFNRPSGNQDGEPSAFNEFGQLAFFARFTDGSSGVFVSSLVAVPEPCAAYMLAICVSIFWLSSWSRLRVRGCGVRLSLRH